ncbi:MAG: pyridoxamine 5'-phosphate oxidase family protein [Planctomycetales bacterium]
MSHPHPDLKTLPEEIWRLLFASVEDPLHPWRTPVLGTVDAKGECALRTIVLRRVNPVERKLIVFTDRRSPKVAHLQRQPKVEWLFYDPASRVQVRLTGTMSVCSDQNLIDVLWRETPEANRRNYRTAEPPGTRIDHETPLHDSIIGVENFCVLEGRVEGMDYLQLLPEQNLRGQWTWQAGGWVGNWVVP